MNLEPLSPGNSTVVLVDYAVGFADILRSHDLAHHIACVTGLARVATLYESGLVVTNGEPTKPSGPLYPEILDAIGDHPVVERAAGYAFNAFRDPAFAAAVEAENRKRLVIGGIATDGCVLQTTLAALRLGYEAYVVVDAVASTSQEAHEVAIQRMTLAGAVPVTWWSLAAEYQLDEKFADAPFRAQLMAEFQPAMTMSSRTYFAGARYGSTN